MIDNFSDKIMKLLIRKGLLKKSQYSDADFYFRIFLFNSIIIGLLLTINIFTYSYKELITIGITFNLIRINCISNGFHADTLEKCIVISTVYISICSILAHILIPYSILICIIAVISLFYLYIRYIPSKICFENEKKYIILSLILVGLMTTGIFLCLKFPSYQWIVSGIGMGILSVSIITCDVVEDFLKKIQKYI